MSFKPEYVFDGEPAAGDVREVAPGVFWLRMPLPFKLDHVNLWLLQDGDGWAIVDTGIDRDDVRAAWEQVFERHLGGLPVTRVIVTHFHPDHAGLAGWLTSRWNCPLLMPFTEWAYGRMLSLDTGAQSRETFHAFYQGAGFDDAMLEIVDRRVGRYSRSVSVFPAACQRLEHGQLLVIGGRTWQVTIAGGHSPEHACLYAPDLKLLIAADQILPKISPNVSVWPQEPDAEPLSLFLEGLDGLRELPEDTLVLPGHNWPFKGLRARIEDLFQHHRERLGETLEACRGGATGLDVLRRLFTRELDDHQLFFAIGETLAHIHHLETRGQIERGQTADGAYTFHPV